MSCSNISIHCGNTKKTTIIINVKIKKTLSVVDVFFLRLLVDENEMERVVGLT